MARQYRFIVQALCAAAVFAGAGCADKLPDQDLRILTTQPAAKLSTEILWTEYKADQKAADRKYKGEVVELTGVPTSVNIQPPKVFFMSLGQTAGLEAILLDEQAVSTLSVTKVGERITLRCFCEGLEGNVILKSCIKP